MFLELCSRKIHFEELRNELAIKIVIKPFIIAKISLTISWMLKTLNHSPVKIHSGYSSLFAGKNQIDK